MSDGAFPQPFEAYEATEARSFLSGDVRYKSHKARALYCKCKHSLMFCAYTRFLSRHNARVRIEEFFKCLGIFIVDMFYVIC